MFSKNTKTILTYLAILIIFYGAYKAVFNLKEVKNKIEGMVQLKGEPFNYVNDIYEYTE
tara:strand:- start:660 stop:836 length:177 start_codon:yes stop_codon:yes gene_type:complete